MALQVDDSKQSGMIGHTKQYCFYSVPIVAFNFGWCKQTKSNSIDVTDYDTKAQLREKSSQFHAVRSIKPIPRNVISIFYFDIFIDKSSSGNFYGLISSEVRKELMSKPWYSFAQKDGNKIYGVDDNPNCVYEGTARVPPKYKRPDIPIKQVRKLNFIADYTKECCVLTVKMLNPQSKEFGLVYQFSLPPNQVWYPAVQFEEPGSWAKIALS